MLVHTAFPKCYLIWGQAAGFFSCKTISKKKKKIEPPG